MIIKIKMTKSSNSLPQPSEELLNGLPYKYPVDWRNCRILISASDLFLCNKAECEGMRYEVITVNNEEIYVVYISRSDYIIIRYYFSLRDILKRHAEIQND